MTEVYSIRESLQGRLQTFIRGSGLRSIFLEDLIRDIVVLLSSYREENISMFPPVFIGARREDLAPIFTIGAPVVIGSVAQTSESAATVLKECAPLAREGWAVFVFPDTDTTLSYGVFRSTRHSLSTGADEAIQDLGTTVQLVLIKNCGHQAVELHNTSKGTLVAVFKIAAVAHQGMDEHISIFVKAATAALTEPSEFQLYLKRTLSVIIQHCHGTLLSVIPDFVGFPPSTMTSGVCPDPSIDLAGLHTEALRLQDANSLADLRAAEILLEGMIGSDGIVVFGRDSSIRAYRSFIKPEPHEVAFLPSEGGARRRTFELMKLRINTEYTAALYRSQDGEMKCEARA